MAARNPQVVQIEQLSQEALDRGHTTTAIAEAKTRGRERARAEGGLDARGRATTPRARAHVIDELNTLTLTTPVAPGRAGRPRGTRAGRPARGIPAPPGVPGFLPGVAPIARGQGRRVPGVVFRGGAPLRRGGRGRGRGRGGGRGRAPPRDPAVTAANARLKAAREAARARGHQTTVIKDTARTLAGEDPHTAAAKNRKAQALEDLTRTAPRDNLPAFGGRDPALGPLPRARPHGVPMPAGKARKGASAARRRPVTTRRPTQFQGQPTYRVRRGNPRKLQGFRNSLRAQGLSSAQIHQANITRAENRFAEEDQARQAFRQTVLPGDAGAFYHGADDGGLVLGGRENSVRGVLHQIDIEEALRVMDFNVGGTASTARRLYINSMLHFNPGVSKKMAERMWKGISGENKRNWMNLRKAMIRVLRGDNETYNETQNVDLAIRTFAAY